MLNFKNRKHYQIRMVMIIILNLEIIDEKDYQ